jgi:hypothetical protein
MLLKQSFYRQSRSRESDPLSGVCQVRNCYLVGLNDLAGAKDYVRTKIAAYLQVIIPLFLWLNSFKMLMFV